MRNDVTVGLKTMNSPLSCRCFLSIGSHRNRTCGRDSCIGPSTKICRTKAIRPRKYVRIRSGPGRGTRAYLCVYEYMKLLFCNIVGMPMLRVRRGNELALDNGIEA